VIKTNLSTRPFYNDGAVRLWLMILAVIVVLATVFNVTRVLQYSRSDTELATQASRDETRTTELRAEAAKLRGSVDAKQIAAASVEARAANELIDRRTFSWTELFNHLEATIPADVRITAVRPKIENDGRIVLAIAVVSRSIEEIDRFLNSLDDTSAFNGTLSREDHVNDEGQIEATIETLYRPRREAAAKPADPRGPAAAPRRGAQ